jgi:hypothetical protein
MAKNQQVIKLFVVLLLSTAFIFSFSHFGAQAFDNLTNLAGKYSSGTSIGALNVSGKTGSEAVSMLEEKYLDWVKGTKITLQYQEKNVPFNLDLFHLDSKRTVDSIKDGQQNSAIITIDKKQVEEQLQSLYPQLKSSDFDLDKLTTSLIQTASKFVNSTYNLNLYNDYLLADRINKNGELNVAELPLKEAPYDLQSFIEENPKLEITGESTFSLLGFLKQQKQKLKPETLNIIATGIYQAILPTNFTIGERNIGNTLPGYATLGYEAKVNLDNNADLIFTNPNKEKFVLEFQYENSSLKVILNGGNFLYNYKITTKEEQKLEPKTIIQYSPLLLSGKTMIKTKGEEGKIAKIYRDVYQGDQFMKSELISEDYYPPVYQVEVHALAANQQGTSQTAGTTTSSPSGTNTANSSNQNGNQTTTTDSTQESSNISDLWGKPNEQPK